MLNVASSHKFSQSNLSTHTHTPSVYKSPTQAQLPLNIHLVTNQRSFFSSTDPADMTLTIIPCSLSPTILTTQNNKRNKSFFLTADSFFNSIHSFPPTTTPILCPAFVIQKLQGLRKSHSPHAIGTSTQFLADPRQTSIKVLHQPRFNHFIRQRQLQSPGHPGSFLAPGDTVSCIKVSSVILPNEDKTAETSKPRSPTQYPRATPSPTCTARKPNLSYPWLLVLGCPDFQNLSYAAPWSRAKALLLNYSTAQRQP